MFTPLLLTAALVSGQAPAAPNYPTAAPPGMRPVLRSMPQDAPQAMPPATAATPAASAPAAPAGDPSTAPADIKTDKEEPPAPTKYALEKALTGTSLGTLLDKRGIKVYGWTEMSYNAGTASNNNNPVFMTDLANGFLLNQNFLVVDKAVDTSKKEVQYGFGVNLILPGSDARTTLVRGLFDGQVTNPNHASKLYPIDPYQFYGTVFLPGLGAQGTTVKVGRFATHLEYEVVQAPDTPFVTRSLLFQYNPFTHTGVWATTQVSDDWTIGNGIAGGNDVFIDQAMQPQYLGQLKYAPKDGKTQVLLNAAVTSPRFNDRLNFNQYNVYNLQFIQKVTDKLTYVFDTAFSHEDNIPDVGSANWYGAVQYLNYQHTEKVASNFRFELFEDSKGVRTGSAGLYTGVTYGVTYKPIESVIVRPSVLYMNHNRNAPFEGNQNLVTASLDVILRW